MKKSYWYLTLSIHRYFEHSYKQYLNITNRPETRNNTTKMGGIEFTTDSDLMILSSGDFCGLLKNRCLLLHELLCKRKESGGERESEKLSEVNAFGQNSNTGGPTCRCVLFLLENIKTFLFSNILLPILAGLF